jgi:hypothetical protein
MRAGLAAGAVLAVLAAGAGDLAAAPGPAPRISIDAGRVYLSAAAVPQDALLRALADAAGLVLSGSPVTGDPVTLTLDGVTLAEAVAALLHPQCGYALTGTAGGAGAPDAGRLVILGCADPEVAAAASATRLSPTLAPHRTPAMAPSDLMEVAEGPVGADALAVLEPALADPGPERRKAALEGLKRQMERADPAQRDALAARWGAALAGALHDPEPGLGRTALELVHALARLDEHDGTGVALEAAVAAMTEAMGHADPDLRKEAIGLLKEIPGVSASEVMALALDDADADLRREAAAKLAERDDPAAAAALEWVRGADVAPH